VICNLDGNPVRDYFEFNLIEARAAAILTPHPNAARAVVFLGLFPLRPTNSSDESWLE
jgi:hypothetical protein